MPHTCTQIQPSNRMPTKSEMTIFAQNIRIDFGHIVDNRWCSFVYCDMCVCWKIFFLFYHQICENTRSRLPFHSNIYVIHRWLFDTEHLFNYCSTYDSICNAIVGQVLGSPTSDKYTRCHPQTYSSIRRWELYADDAQAHTRRVWNRNRSRFVCVWNFGFYCKSIVIVNGWNSERKYNLTLVDFEKKPNVNSSNHCHRLDSCVEFWERRRMWLVNWLNNWIGSNV